MHLALSGSKLPNPLNTRLLTYRAVTATQSSYLYKFITVQPPRRTRFSSLATLAWPPTSSLLRITDRSFWCASHCLWNPLLFLSVNLVPLSLSLTHLFIRLLHHRPLLIHHFHRLHLHKTTCFRNPCHHRLCCSIGTTSMDYYPNRFFSAHLFLFLLCSYLSVFFGAVW